MANIYVGDSYGCLLDLLFSWENLHCSFFLELVQTFLDNQLQPNQSPLLVPRGPWLYLERTNTGYGPWPTARTLNYPPYSGKTISKNILRQHRWLILLKLWDSIIYQEMNLHLHIWQILHYIAFIKTNSRYKCDNCVNHFGMHWCTNIPEDSSSCLLL